MKLHRANHFILKSKLSQSINCNYIYQQWHKYCKSPAVCDFILVLSYASARHNVKGVLLWNYWLKPHVNTPILIIYTKESNCTIQKLKTHPHSQCICTHLHMHGRTHIHWQDLLRAVMTVITSGLTLTSPSWLSDWLGWWRDVNRSASLMLWLGLNYTPSVCFHQCQGRQ